MVPALNPFGKAQSGETEQNPNSKPLWNNTVSINTTTTQLRSRLRSTTNPDAAVLLAAPACFYTRLSPLLSPIPGNRIASFLRLPPVTFFYSVFNLFFYFIAPFSSLSPFSINLGVISYNLLSILYFALQSVCFLLLFVLTHLESRG